MTFDFTQAKNNELTFSVDGKYYHSKYNPSTEAEKWVNQIQCDYLPKVIVILGAGLPYCINSIKEKFSNAIIVLIQYHQDIFSKVKSEYKNYFSKNIFQICVNNFSSVQNFSDYFFNSFGEELSNQILFLSWKTSENIFTNEYNFTISAIQNYLNKSKSLIATRRFFSKKWIANIIRFFNTAKNFYKIEKTKKEILIIASGPSLKKSIKKIKEYKKNFFLICVSSATKVLIENKIIPDLILTTDGGYWAKKHLQFLDNVDYDIPIMCTAESALPYNLLKKNKIIPLEYNDFTNKFFFDKTNLQTIKVNRNGTVSGTALEVAKQLTDKKIYFVGLDLQTTNSYQHSQPNILELNDSLTDNFFNTKENRICLRNINSTALSTYKDWFETLPNDYTKNVKRIFDNKMQYQKLGNIQTINWNEINFLNINEENLITKQTKDKNFDIKKIILDLLNNIENNLQWLSILSLGNILNYNKFNNNLFLEQAIKESKSFLNKQLSKLEQIKNDR